MLATAAATAVAALSGVLGAHSTAYCLTGTTADGTYLSQRAPSMEALRTVAMNRHPLGTKIKLISPRRVWGLRDFVVRDRIGWGSELDFWTPSCWAAINVHGRKNVRYIITGKVR